MVYIIVGALVVGLSLGTFGSGGSILTVPVLLYLLHHEDKVAIAESLGIVGAIALISALPYARAGLVQWRIVLLFGVPGMVGTYLGAWLAAFVAGYVQLLVFAGVMLLAAWRMWRKARASGVVSTGSGDPTESAPKEEPTPHRSAVKIGGEGLAVGVLTGFVGVGGGFLIVPALVLLGGLTMRRAVATSLVIIALKSATGFWKYLDVLERMEATVDWRAMGLFVLVGAVGSFAGKAVSDKVNQRALQRGFAVFLIVMAVFILVKESAGLMGSESTRPDAPSAGPTHGGA